SEVHDWDITTDANRESVEPLISDLEYKIIEPNDVYASSYLFRININGSSVDLIGSFAIHTKQGIYRVPTIVSAEWEGVPVGSPGAWAKAYELIGREEKAKLLSDYIKK